MSDIKIDYKGIFLEEKCEYDIYNLVTIEKPETVLTDEEGQEIIALLKSGRQESAERKLRDRLSNYIKLEIDHFKKYAKLKPKKLFQGLNRTYNGYLATLEASGNDLRKKNKVAIFKKRVNEYNIKIFHGALVKQWVTYNYKDEELQRWLDFIKKYDNDTKKAARIWVISRKKHFEIFAPLNSSQVLEGYTINWKDYSAIVNEKKRIQKLKAKYLQQKNKNLKKLTLS